MSTKKSQKYAISRRYAAALFALASQKKVLDAVEKDMNAVVASIISSPELQRVLQSPVISKEKLAEIFNSLGKKIKIQPLTQRFCQVVAEQRRLGIFMEIAAAFASMLAAARGEVTARVTVAAPLTETQKKKMAKQLQETMGKVVAIEENIDDSIIGGLIIQIGSTMLDQSINGKLERLRVVQKQAALPI